MFTFNHSGSHTCRRSDSAPDNTPHTHTSTTVRSLFHVCPQQKTSARLLPCDLSRAPPTSASLCTCRSARNIWKTLTPAKETNSGSSGFLFFILSSSQKHDATDSGRGQKTYFLHWHHTHEKRRSHRTSKMDTFLHCVLLFLYYSLIGFCGTCQAFKSQFHSPVHRCENYLVVGVLFLNLDIMASGILLCLAKSRDALLCQQEQIYDLWFIILHYCGFCGKMCCKQTLHGQV